MPIEWEAQPGLSPSALEARMSRMPMAFATVVETEV